MTFPRLPGSADERDADAVVAILCRELLTPMDDAVVAGQLEAMLLEFDWEQEAMPAPRRPRLRTPAVVGSCLVAVALSLTSGLAAAGALPATAQHWLSRATRVIGIPLPDAPGYRLTPSPTRTDPARVVPAPMGAAPTVASDRVAESSAVVQRQVGSHRANPSVPSRVIPQPTEAGAHPVSAPDPSSSQPAAAVAPAENDAGDSAGGTGGTGPKGDDGNSANAGAGKSAAAHAAHGPGNAGGRSAVRRQNGNATEQSSETDTVDDNVVKNKDAKGNGVEHNGVKNNPGADLQQ